MEGTIGARLKTEREKRGLSRDDVHAHIRIHPQILENLEENRFQKLPAPIYTKGFIRHYCTFLELNSDDFISEYDRLNVPHAKQTLVIKSKNKAPTSGLFPDLAIPSPKRTLDGIKANRKVLLTILGVLIVVYAGWQLTLYFKERPPAKPTQAKGMMAVAPMKSARSDSPYLNSVSQGNFPKISPKVPLKLMLKATTAVWVRVAADEVIVFESILRPGQFKEWEAERLYDLQLGRPEGINLTLNGHFLGSPGNVKAKHLVINRKGIRRL